MELPQLSLLIYLLSVVNNSFIVQYGINASTTLTFPIAFTSGLHGFGHILINNAKDNVMKLSTSGFNSSQMYFVEVWKSQNNIGSTTEWSYLWIAIGY